MAALFQSSVDNKKVRWLPKLNRLSREAILDIKLKHHQSQLQNSEQFITKLPSFTPKPSIHPAPMTTNELQNHNHAYHLNCYLYNLKQPNSVESCKFNNNYPNLPGLKYSYGNSKTSTDPTSLSQTNSNYDEAQSFGNYSEHQTGPTRMSQNNYNYDKYYQQQYTKCQHPCCLPKNQCFTPPPLIPIQYPSNYGKVGNFPYNYRNYNNNYSASELLTTLGDKSNYYNNNQNYPGMANSYKTPTPAGNHSQHNKEQEYFPQNANRWHSNQYWPEYSPANSFEDISTIDSNKLNANSSNVYEPKLQSTTTKFQCEPVDYSSATHTINKIPDQNRNVPSQFQCEPTFTPVFNDTYNAQQQIRYNHDPNLQTFEPAFVRKTTPAVFNNTNNKQQRNTNIFTPNAAPVFQDAKSRQVQNISETVQQTSDNSNDETHPPPSYNASLIAMKSQIEKYSKYNGPTCFGNQSREYISPVGSTTVDHLDSRFSSHPIYSSANNNYITPNVEYSDTLGKFRIHILEKSIPTAPTVRVLNENNTQEPTKNPGERKTTVTKSKRNKTVPKTKTIPAVGKDNLPDACLNSVNNGVDRRKSKKKNENVRECITQANATKAVPTYDSNCYIKNNDKIFEMLNASESNIHETDNRKNINKRKRDQQKSSEKKRNVEVCIEKEITQLAPQIHNTETIYEKVWAQQPIISSDDAVQKQPNDPIFSTPADAESVQSSSDLLSDEPNGSSSLSSTESPCTFENLISELIKNAFMDNGNMFQSKESHQRSVGSDHNFNELSIKNEVLENEINFVTDGLMQIGPESEVVDMFIVNDDQDDSSDDLLLFDIDSMETELRSTIIDETIPSI